MVRKRVGDAWAVRRHARRSTACAMDSALKVGKNPVRNVLINIRSHCCRLRHVTQRRPPKSGGRPSQAEKRAGLGRAGEERSEATTRPAGFRPKGCLEGLGAAGPRKMRRKAQKRVCVGHHAKSKLEP